MSSCIFQQNKDPKLSVKTCKQWVIRNMPTLRKTPAQLPDLNPIEHLWAHFKIRVHCRSLQSKQELKFIVTEE